MDTFAHGVALRNATVRGHSQQGQAEGQLSREADPTAAAVDTRGSGAGRIVSELRQEGGL